MPFLHQARFRLGDVLNALSLPGRLARNKDHSRPAGLVDSLDQGLQQRRLSGLTRSVDRQVIASTDALEKTRTAVKKRQMIVEIGGMLLAGSGELLYTGDACFNEVRMVRRVPMASLWLLLVGGLWAADARAEEVDPEKISLAVMDLASEGASPDLAASLTGLVAAELERLRVFQVISRQDMRALVQHEAQRQSLGCDGDDCTHRLGTMLGVRYLVSGSVGRVGDELSVTLSLSEVALSRVVGRAARTVSSPAALLPAIPGLIRTLASPVLAARQATLLVPCAEVGATVKLDGQLVGTTPLGRRPVAWGPHRLEVEKAGFVAAAEEFTVQTTGLVERPVTLVPSPDFLESYETGAQRMRWGAWLTGGAAAVALAVSALFQSQHMTLGSRYESGYVEYMDAGRPSSQYDALRQLRLDADGALLSSRLSASAAALFAGGLAYFWVAGPDPDRYARYRGSEPGGTRGDAASE